MSFFSKSSGIVVSIPEFDRTEEITVDVYPIYNYVGGYIGYVDHGNVFLIDATRIDPIKTNGE